MNDSVIVEVNWGRKMTGEDTTSQSGRGAEAKRNCWINIQV